MSDVSPARLRKEIQAILKDADLSSISAKRVREQVESKLDCSLVSRKKEFDKIVMDVINEQQNDDDDEDEEDGSDPDADPEDQSEDEDPSSDEDAKKKKAPQKKRPQPTQHKSGAKKKRKSLNASDSGTETDGGSDSDYEVPKKTPVKKKKAAGGAAGGAGGGTGRKGTGFTRSYQLSPELSALMGAEALPRHAVVKKVWAIIKERELYDPKNKQFAICDDELMKVMKVKRFRTFGMMKHLKPHFLD